MSNLTIEQAKQILEQAGYSLSFSSNQDGETDTIYLNDVLPQSGAGHIFCTYDYTSEVSENELLEQADKKIELSKKYQEDCDNNPILTIEDEF